MTPGRLLKGREGFCEEEDRGKGRRALLWGYFHFGCIAGGEGASLSAAGKEAWVSQTLLLLLPPSLLLSTRLFKAAKVGGNSPNIFFKQKRGSETFFFAGQFMNAFLGSTLAANP